MRKVTAFALVCTMVFALAACGKKPTEDKKTTDATQENPVSAQETKDDTSEPQQGVVDVNPVELLFHPAKAGSYATIKVDASVKMDDESAWLGLCPAGKDYITESEADEVDVIWYSLDWRDNEDDPYVWACDFSEVEDGTYALVIATSDDENVGYIAIQLTMVKDGENLTFDYSNAELKERP